MVSGYKNYELGIFKENHPGIEIIKIALKRQLRQLIEEGLEWIFISGNLGVELWCAEVVYELKIEFPQLKLAVVTPFLNQEERWKEETQMYYKSIVSKADYVKSTSSKPYTAPWQFARRDEVVMNKCDGLLLVYDDEKDGSPKFLKYKALKYTENNSFELFFINSYDLQSIAEEKALEEREKQNNEW